MRRVLVSLLFVVLGTPVSPSLSAQTPSNSAGAEAPFAVPRLDEPLALDGRRDKAAWESIEPLPAVMHIPVFGVEPSERTEFRLAHDGEFLYYSCRAYDSEPAAIQIMSLRRNELGWSSDRCAIYIDSSNDEENSLGFLTTAAGVRIDIAYTLDGMGPNPNWNTHWDVAVQRDELGWHAEFRIPFSSLLFQPDEHGQVVMGVSMLRTVARKNERAIHPAIPPSWGGFSHTRAPEMRKIVMEGLEEVNPVYVTPYVLGGTGHSFVHESGQAQYERRSVDVGEMGLDVKYNLTSNLTLDLSVNTDFAQVEADDEQINLTRFSLFFPEKRRFFQERNSNFEYSLGGQERLFHSRRVGLVEGEPTRIYGGGRVVGRVGEWDVGILNMQTAETEIVAPGDPEPVVGPSENQGVVRLRRRILNPYSYVGGIFTSRIGSGGDSNLVYGLDGIFRMADQDFLTINWAQSFGDDEVSEGETGSLNPIERGLFRVYWERRGLDGLTYSLDLSRVGRAFEPDMGFLRRQDYVKGDLNFAYGWRPGPESPLLRYALELQSTVFRRNLDRTVETVTMTPALVLETKTGSQVTLSIPTQYENLRTGFSLTDDVVVPATDIHRFSSVRLQYRPPAGALSYSNARVEAGRFYDGRMASASIGPSWSPSIHFNLSGSYGLEYVDFSERNQGFTAHVARLRSEVYFSAATSADAFVQYNSQANTVSANIRFRYNPREGNDLYLVWNEGLVTNRDEFDPVHPRSSNRSLLIKYSHTLQFDL